MRAAEEATMAVKVREIMNPELFAVKDVDRADDAIASLLALGLSAAPVLDRDGKLVGMVSWRDLVREPHGMIADKMTGPPSVVREDDLIESAGRLMALTGFHHAPVVNVTGKLVGFLSILDVLRGLLGIPATHPAGFPHYDEETGVVWTDELPLEEERFEAAPDGPGVLVLIEGGAQRPEIVVWAESTGNVRSRLVDLVSEPQAPLQLARWLDSTSLRFRAAAVADDEARRKLAHLLVTRARRSAWLERLGE
jgi:CBS domain-containing protein